MLCASVCVFIFTETNNSEEQKEWSSLETCNIIVMLSRQLLE